MSFEQIGQAVSAVAIVVVLALMTHSVGADIFEWEFIDPGNPLLGKRESTILITTDNAEPGTDLSLTDLTRAYLRDADLTGALMSESDLTQAFLVGARLRNANMNESIFTGSDLTGADFAGSFIGQSHFTNTTVTGFTEQQLASTANYASGRLDRIRLDHNDLTGWDLSAQSLEFARFSSSMMRQANISNA